MLWEVSPWDESPGKGWLSEIPEKIFLIFLSSRRGGGDLGKLWIFLVCPAVFGDSSVRDGSLGPSYNEDMENLCWESFFPSGMGKRWGFVDGALYFNQNKPYRVLNATELGPNKWQESSEFSVVICSDLFNRSIFFISFWKSNFVKQKKKNHHVGHLNFFWKAFQISTFRLLNQNKNNYHTRQFAKLLISKTSRGRKKK